MVQTSGKLQKHQITEAWQLLEKSQLIYDDNLEMWIMPFNAISKEQFIKDAESSKTRSLTVLDETKGPGGSKLSKLMAFVIYGIHPRSLDIKSIAVKGNENFLFIGLIETLKHVGQNALPAIPRVQIKLEKNNKLLENFLAFGFKGCNDSEEEPYHLLYFP